MVSSNGLSIPGPAERVEKVALDKPLDAPTVSKKGKLLVPQPNSVTAQYVVFHFGLLSIVFQSSFSNLFAVNYMLKHLTTTVAEFGIVWKELDKETRNVCYQLIFSLEI